MRKKLGKPHSPYYARYNWESVDWTLQDSKIAEVLGCSTGAVFHARRRLGKAQSPNHYKRTKQRYAWDTVDWTRQNKSIARDLGCSHQIVSRNRLALGMPPSPDHYKSGPKVEPVYMEKARTLDLKSMTASQVAQALGVSKAVVYNKFRGKFKWSKPSHDWAIISPESCAILSDEQLAKMIGCHKQLVVLRRIERGIYRDAPRGKKNANKTVAHVGRWCKSRGGTLK